MIQSLTSSHASAAKHTPPKPQVPGEENNPFAHDFDYNQQPPEPQVCIGFEPWIEQGISYEEWQKRQQQDQQPKPQIPGEENNPFAHDFDYNQQPRVGFEPWIEQGISYDEWQKRQQQPPEPKPAPPPAPSGPYTNWEDYARNQHNI